MKLLPATPLAGDNILSAIEKPSNPSPKEFTALESILDDDRDEREEAFHEASCESRASTFEAGKSFWMNLLETRDGRSSDDAATEDGEYRMQEDEPRSGITTSINQDIQIVQWNDLETIQRTRMPSLDVRGGESSLETRTAVVQKWETIVRSNGLENLRNETEFNDKHMLGSHEHVRRSIDDVISRSITSNLTNVLRSVSDVTNKFNKQTTTDIRSKIGENNSNFVLHVNNRNIKESHPVKKSLLPDLTLPDNRKLEQSSRNITSNRDGICTSNKPFALYSCQGIKKIGPNQDDRKRFRRVYDTWYQAGLMKDRAYINKNVGKETTSSLLTNIVTPSSIREFDNHQRSCSKKELSNANLNTTSSDECAMTRSDNVDSISNMVLDKNGLKRLVNIFSKGKSFQSNIDITQDITKETEKEGKTPKYILSEDSTVTKNQGRDEDKLCRRNDIEPVRALITLKKRNICDLLIGEAQQTNKNGGEDQLIIQNRDTVLGCQGLSTQFAQCKCSWSAFSGNDDLLSFFLPQMGMACACDRPNVNLINLDDPTAIENILRPWQVEFLQSFGIYKGEQLVKARHRSGGIMARALRQWRKKHFMVPFKTRSCATALQIWSKISKAYVRAVRKQELDGNKNFERESGTLLLNEMSQFLDELPMAPSKRRDRVTALSNIETESQVEI